MKVAIEMSKHPTKDEPAAVIDEVGFPIDNEPMVDTATTSLVNGKEVTSVLTMKRFASPDWIMQNCVVKGAGTKVQVARIIGKAMQAERKQNTYQDKTLESIVLRGVFEGENLLTGEIISASEIYLPRAYAQQVAVMFMDETVKRVELDLDIGVRATGKTIPYEWTCTTFTDDGFGAELSRIRSRRRPNPLTLAHDKPAAQITK